MPLPTRLDGPAPTWPRPVDAALEWWAVLPARGRVALRAALAVVLLTAASGGLVRGPWGPPIAVVVTTADVVAGATITTAEIGLVDRPRDLVPSDALRSTEELPADAVVSGHLPTGTIVTARAVTGGGPAATAVEGTAVVLVPGDALPPLPVGTRMDLAVAGFDGSARIVARDAILVGDDGTWRWIRVERDSVGEVAHGVTDGTLVAAVLPARRGGGP